MKTRSMSAPMWLLVISLVTGPALGDDGIASKYPGDTNGEMALWIDGKPVSHLGKGFPKGKWVYDKFLPGEGGEGVRWNDAKRGPEQLEFPDEGLPFDGFRWRSEERLKLNFLWVLLYITKSPQDHVSKVWFDNIVVATEYIGPIRSP